MKKLFTEMMSVEAGKIRSIALKEEEKKDYSAHWRAPVWHLDTVNLNGRVYGTELAKRIVAENQVTGVCDGHDPDYHFEFKNFVAVAKNPTIEDGFLYVDIYMVDQAFAQNLEKMHALGLPIGVSSCGYGETDQYGNVVAATYELIRYMDFVTSPAGLVYATPKEEGKGKPTGKPAGDEASKLAAKASAYLKVNDFLRSRS